ncbi:MAG: ARMT1-like domain-containing protein [Clostridia bacterium]|nr:ARMT1-like domain-containing protein [Clostridia bacterium]
MKLNSNCMACQLRKQEAKIRHFDDEDRKKQYMEEIRRRFENPREGDCVPSISTELKKFYCSFWGVPMEDFAQINQEYDQLMLDLEDDLHSTIRYSEDPLKAALIYARTGNYIDFAALPEVSKETALFLIKSENKDTLDEQEYKNFCQDMKEASNVVYITDNCGEIVLDKIAIQVLKKAFPNIRVTALVRGLPAGNDATMEDAEFCGLTDIVPVLGNGSDVGGTWFHGISTHTQELLQNADVILAKGQGNYETMHGCGLNIYYLFLCKCDWFQKLFHAKPLQGMFINERRAPRETAFSSD